MNQPECLRYIVCAEAEVPEAAFQFTPTHVVSITDPGRVADLGDLADASRTLRLSMEDVSRIDAPMAPAPLHAERLLAFGASLPDEARVLFHCMAGVSRSAAAVLLLSAQKRGWHEPDSLMSELLSVRPQAFPNLPLVAHGDAALGAGGALVDVVRERDRRFPFPGLRDLSQNG